MVEVMPYSPPNFWTQEGAIAKKKQLEKVFPDVFNWRFVTLTFNQHRYDSPEEAYRHGIESIRHFVSALIHRFGYSIRRYAWKLEFHEPNAKGEIWPHFHLVLDYKRKIELEHLNRAWGKRGFTHIERVRSRRGLDYLLKYITKGAGILPDWILEMHKPRAWQTSRNFYRKVSANNGGVVSEQEASPRPAGEDRASDTQNSVERPRSTLGARIKRWSHTVVVRSLCQKTGKVIFRGVEMTTAWGETLTHFALNCFDQFRRPRWDYRIQNKLKIIIPCQKTLTLLPLKNPLQILMAAS